MAYELHLVIIFSQKLNVNTFITRSIYKPLLKIAPEYQFEIDLFYWARMNTNHVRDYKF